MGDSALRGAAGRGFGLPTVGLSCLLAATCAVAARDIFVNNQTGIDQNAGTANAPFRTAGKAVSVVSEGDTIHLLPERSVYREMVTIRNKRDFKIEGHDCVVSGADPLPSDPTKWEKVDEALHRIRLRATSGNRHILVVNGRAEMMGRTKYNLESADDKAHQVVVQPGSKRGGAHRRPESQLNEGSEDMRRLPAGHVGIICSIALVGTMAAGPEARAAEGYALSFSTYLGGSGGEDTARAVAVDANENIFVAGGTRSADFPTTPGAYDRTYNGGGRSSGARGPMDVFVTKLDPRGRVVWSTFLGGPNYDRVYTIRVDRQGFVYLAGRAGEGFPTTPGTVQPKFAGDQRGGGAYGKQDGFLAKLSPDGSRLVWSTYFGTPGPAIIRDMDIDAEGAIYLVMIELSHPSAHVTRGAFQERPPGGKDSLIAKVSPDARRVVWCTYLGGSGRDLAPSLRVDAAGRPVVFGSTFSPDFPVTAGAFQRQRRGKQDAFVAKLAADGSRLVYATLLGGSNEDGAAGKHGLALDAAGRACVVGFTSSGDFPTTPKAFQRRYAGRTTGTWRQTGDRFIAVVSADGRRLEAATLLGGNARDGGEGIEVDAAGRVYLGGLTYSTDFPVTRNAYQSRYGGGARPHGPMWGGGDATVVVFSPDLQRTLFSTYMGGSGEDLFRACAITAKGELVLVGSTTSTDWPTKNAVQSSPAGGPDEVIVAKFHPLD